MTNEEFLEEVKRYYSDNFNYISSEEPTLSLLTNIARHFAKWGAEHVPLPEDTVLFNKGVEEGRRLEQAEKDPDKQWDKLQSHFKEINEAFEDGKKAMREQMMEEAVEGEVVQDLKGVNRVKSFGKIPEGLHFGDKVRIIILPKED